MNKVNIFIFFIVLNLIVISVACPQEGDSNQTIVDDSIQDISIVVGMGLFGAILGLSTLSFVDEPKKHLRSIIVGASLGTIVGVGIVAWTQANRSRSMYYDNAMRNELYRKNFGTSERLSWHIDQHSYHLAKLGPPTPDILYTFSF